MKIIIPFSLSILLLLAYTSMDQEIDQEQERIIHLMLGINLPPKPTTIRVLIERQKMLFSWTRMPPRTGIKLPSKFGERHIYFDKTGKAAWFDELLNSQMKIFRGSGVLVKTGKE